MEQEDFNIREHQLTSKERDFENSSYDDIKCVYSIWICMNMEENTMSHIHLTKEDMIGSYEWKGNLDLLNIIMIGLAKELPEHDETCLLYTSDAADE